MASIPPDIDWQRVEADYRSGHLSNIEIGKKHGISEGLVRKRAKLHNWTKDLSAKVTAAVRAGLVRDDTKARTDEEIVEESAKIGADVVRSHRKDVAKARAVAEKLLKELLDVSEHRLSLEQMIEEETAEDRSPKRRESMLRAISLGSRANIIKDLATASKTLIDLERKAFNLDADQDSNKGLSLFDLVMASYNKGATLPK